MKKNIHPKWNESVPVIVNGKEVMTVGSTLPEISVEIWSGNHPFYTGKETLVDTDNLVDKFHKRAEKAAKTRVSKTNKRERRREAKKSLTSGESLTLKDMLKNLK